MPGDLIFEHRQVAKPTLDGMRAAAFVAEEIMMNSPERLRIVDPKKWPLFHHFAHELYGRELHIPKGYYFTGHIHKYDQLNILSRGDISVATDLGLKRVQSGFHMVAPAGVKRIFYVHEDSIWTTMHGTNLRDLSEIEAFFIAHSEEEYQQFLDQQKLLAECVERMEV